MIDIKFLRENPEAVKENIKKKFQDEKIVLVNEVIELDKELRAAQLKADNLRGDRNKLSKQIGGLMAQGKKDDALKLLKNGKTLVEDTDAVDNLIAEAEEGVTGGDYILPESNSRYLTDADVSGLTLQQLNYAKNEIYARHGRKFDSKELQNYFGSKSWYNGTVNAADFKETVFNEYEKKNAEFLRQKEFAMHDGGYQLDQ